MSSTQLLTIREVQSLLRLGRTAVYRLIDAGEITRIKLSPKAARITADSVQAFVERRAA